jgi:alpha-beta hydrolase superfamily lysophospholipase
MTIIDKFVLLGIGFVLFIVALFIAAIIYMNNYIHPAEKRLAKAGILEKNVKVGDINFHYAEGPNNGPALLLLHAQLLDWYAYSSVLPELSTKFHVFAVDYPGHGRTTYPANYPMTANQIGGDLANYILTVVGEPTYVTGNSSGELLTT